LQLSFRTIWVSFVARAPLAATMLALLALLATTSLGVANASAEPLAAKPKVRVTLPGLAPKTYRTTKVTGGYFARVSLPASASAGAAQVHVMGTDTGAGAQATDYSIPLN
jgi:hypothetical protein